MRVRSRVTSLSWIPSESMAGAYRLSFDLGVTHWDPPPPDRIDVADDPGTAIEAMHRAGSFRWANVLEGWLDVEDGTVTGHGFGDDSGLVMGSTTVRLARYGLTFAAVSLPVLRSVSGGDDGTVTLKQTVGGRTAAPLPRPTPRAPYVRWQSPIVWTTLTLTLRPDGTSEGSMTGASAFPRHWVYDADGRVAWKSGFADEGRWLAHSFGDRTPWGDQDRPALVTAVESEDERLLSALIMRGGAKPTMRSVAERDLLTRQGDPGDELYLLLDGVAQVEVDGRLVAEVGPGAIVGERAILETGRRTSSVRAVTPLRVAVAARDRIDLDRLRAVAASHHREDEGPDD